MYSRPLYDWVASGEEIGRHERRSLARDYLAGASRTEGERHMEKTSPMRVRPLHPLGPLQQLRQCLNDDKLFLRNDSLVTFVCGAGLSNGRPTCRSTFMEYAATHLRAHHFFESETVIAALTGKTKYPDLLTLEERLAKYADCILIFLESAGAFAEAGAFAMNPSVAQITLVVNDRKFRAEESFLTRGPLRRIARQSTFGDTVYADFESILTCVPAVSERLRRIERKRRLKVDVASRNSLKNAKGKIRMLFLADLIALLSPVSVSEIRDTIVHFYGTPGISVDVELGLLCSLKLVRANRSECGQMLVREWREENLFFDYDGLDMPRLRAGVICTYRKQCRHRSKFLLERARGGEKWS